METLINRRLLNRNLSKKEFNLADSLKAGKDLMLLRLGQHSKYDDKSKNKIADAFEIIKMIFKEPSLNRRTVESVLKANSRHYLIKNKKEIVGCVGFEVSSGKIDCIFIKPAFRQKGYMKKVLETFAKNNRHLYLATSDENKPMNKLAAKMGFKQVKVGEQFIYQLKN